MHASPGARDGQRGRGLTPSRTVLSKRNFQFVLFLSCSSSHFVFRGNNFGIISIEFVSQNSSLRLTWKNYILQLYFFLTNKVSAKNNSQQQEYISRGILLSSDRIFEIFWLRTKKMSLLHSRALKILTPTRRAPGEEKNVWGFSPIIRPEVRAKIRVYFKIRARGEQGGGKEMVLWKSVHPFLNPSVWWQMVSRLVTWHFELDLIMRRIIEQVRNRVSRPSNVNLWHLSDISCKGWRPKSLFRALDTKRIDLAARVKKKTQFIDIR